MFLLQRVEASVVRVECLLGAAPGTPIGNAHPGHPGPSEYGKLWGSFQRENLAVLWQVVRSVLVMRLRIQDLAGSHLGQCVGLRRKWRPSRCSCGSKVRARDERGCDEQTHDSLGRSQGYANPDSGQNAFRPLQGGHSMNFGEPRLNVWATQRGVFHNIKVLVACSDPGRAGQGRPQAARKGLALTGPVSRRCVRAGPAGTLLANRTWITFDTAIEGLRV